MSNDGRNLPRGVQSLDEVIKPMAQELLRSVLRTHYSDILTVEELDDFSVFLHSLFSDPLMKGNEKFVSTPLRKDDFIKLREQIIKKIKLLNADIPHYRKASDNDHADGLEETITHLRYIKGIVEKLESAYKVSVMQTDLSSSTLNQIDNK